MPERTILPKPYQKPHPPMWVAVTSPGTEIDAADRGLGSLGLTFGGFAEQEKKIKEYRRRIQLCEPVGAFVNEQVAHGQLPLLPRGRRRPASRWASGSATPSTTSPTQLISAREVYSSPSYQSLGLLPQLRRAGHRARRQRAADRGPGLRRSGAHHPRASRSGSRSASTASTSSSTPTRSCRRTEVLASLRLFAKEVMPAFAKKPAQRRRRRRSSRHAPLRNARPHDRRRARCRRWPTSTPRRGPCPRRRCCSS